MQGLSNSPSWSLSRAVLNLLPAAAMLVIAAAGVAKLANLPAFLESLRTWRTVSPEVLAAATLLLPAAEVGLGLAWLAWGVRRCTRVPAAALLVTVTAAYLLESIDGSPPRCACFGGWDRLPLAQHPVSVVARNSALLLMLVPWSRGRAEASRPAPPRAGKSALRSGLRPGRAFTLAELLLVLVIVAALVGLLLPALAGVRERARDARQLAQLGQHAAVMHMYASDSRGSFPFVYDPASPDGATPIRCDRENFEVRIRPFDLHQWWNVALADAYYDGEMRGGMFASRDPTARSDRTAFQYPIVFLARPEYWRLGTRTTLESQIGATRDAEVTLPAAKVLLGEWVYPPAEPESRDPRQPVALVDGHAAAPRESGFRTRAPFEQAYPAFSSYPSLRQFRYFYTLDGVRGVDLR